MQKGCVSSSGGTTGPALLGGAFAVVTFQLRERGRWIGWINEREGEKGRGGTKALSDISDVSFCQVCRMSFDLEGTARRDER